MPVSPALGRMRLWEIIADAVEAQLRNRLPARWDEQQEWLREEWEFVVTVLAQPCDFP